jgi:glycosyltransferase involved in cell wall biosynthesis
MPRFSIIVPIYNRPDEADELLKSLAEQSSKDFELVLVEDGSVWPSVDAVNRYKDRIVINYISKTNTGRSDTRNKGMQNAKGNYFVFFDSDCIIPSDYFEVLEKYLADDYADCFGGPDSAHESFSDTQKAINYAMTSFLTTGGIRGGKVNMEKFVPRTFNMGFSRTVYETVGGYNKDIDYGEDMDISARIRKSGFSIKLYHNAFVYHKRRVCFKKFYKQVYTFGGSRISTIYKLYPDTLKLVHFLPTTFTLGSIFFVLLSFVFCSAWFLLPLGLYTILLFTDSLFKNKSLKIAALSIVAGYIQLFGYGLGFLKALVKYLSYAKNKLVDI